jgi:hypothetical protein
MFRLLRLSGFTSVKRHSLAEASSADVTVRSKLREISARLAMSLAPEPQLNGGFKASSAARF